MEDNFSNTQWANLSVHELKENKNVWQAELTFIHNYKLLISAIQIADVSNSN